MIQSVHKLIIYYLFITVKENTNRPQPYILKTFTLKSETFTISTGHFLKGEIGIGTGIKKFSIVWSKKLLCIAISFSLLHNNVGRSRREGGMSILPCC